MSGINIVTKVQRIVKTAEEMGFALCYPRHGGGGEDFIGLRPLDDKFPIYGRDDEIWSGSLEQADAFFAGIQFAREYDRVLKISTQAKRERAEQNIRNRELVQLLKQNYDNDQS